MSLPGGFLDIFVQKLAYNFNGFLGNSVLVLHCTAKCLKIPVLIVSKNQKVKMCQTSIVMLAKQATLKSICFIAQRRQHVITINKLDSYMNKNY